MQLLDYTNNSQEDAAFWLAVFEKAMQDGIQLDTTLVYPDPNSYVSVTDDKFTDVAPGKTFEVRTAFALRDGVNPVEVRFSDLFDKKGGTITIDPTTLPREDPKPESAAAEQPMPGRMSPPAMRCLTGGMATGTAGGPLPAATEPMRAGATNGGTAARISASAQTTQAM